MALITSTSTSPQITIVFFPVTKLVRSSSVRIYRHPIGQTQHGLLGPLSASSRRSVLRALNKFEPLHDTGYRRPHGLHAQAC